MSRARAARRERRRGVGKDADSSATESRSKGVEVRRGGAFGEAPLGRDRAGVRARPGSARTNGSRGAASARSPTSPTASARPPVPRANVGSSRKMCDTFAARAGRERRKRVRDFLARPITARRSRHFGSREKNAQARFASQPPARSPIRNARCSAVATRLETPTTPGARARSSPRAQSAPHARAAARRPRAFRAKASARLPTRARRLGRRFPPPRARTRRFAAPARV